MWIKRLLIMIFSVPIFLVAFDGFLRSVDPLGMGRYFHDLALVLNAFQKPSEERSYILPDGVVPLARWTYTIANGIRVVPDTPSRSQCTMVVTGDSVTFGFGVNDAETFVNLLARRFPKVRFVNAGQVGYNIWDSTRIIGYYAGMSGYIYLLTNNDDEVTWRIPMHVGWPEGLELHLSYNPRYVPPKFSAAFHTALTALEARSDVLIVGFAPDKIAKVNIPIYTAWVSRFDAHPGVKGHEQIADALTPLVRAFIRERCQL